MNTEVFTGKAEFYAKGRPGYPDTAMDYIISLVQQKAVFADVGAGTGKFTQLIAKRGVPIYAVEPNADMQEQLTAVLAPFVNTTIITGSAEATTLPDSSVNAIICAQALHWFDPGEFLKECKRIGKPDSIAIAVYNITPGGNNAARHDRAVQAFFKNPTIREFPNPIFYTREKWLIYMTSHSHNPLPSDPNYAAHINEMNEIFDRESARGLLCRQVRTIVYSERIEEI